MKHVQERPGRIEYLYLTPKQAALSEAMNEAVDNLPPNERLRCTIPSVVKKNGKVILYYPHTDYDERTPPSPEQADLMCRTSGVMCPLADLCLKLGKSLEAPVGVWGGKTMLDGEVLRNTKEETNG